MEKIGRKKGKPILIYSALQIGRGGKNGCLWATWAGPSAHENWVRGGKAQHHRRKKEMEAKAIITERIGKRAVSYHVEEEATLRL